MLRDLVQLARPRDWTKNVFVLMPVPFAVAVGARVDVDVLVLGLAAFCLASSAVYTYNDVLDAPFDRRHDSKRERPVAAGRVAPTAALVFSGLLAAAAAALAWATSLVLPLGWIAAYVGVNLVYSHGLKHRPLVDVFLLSSGFVLRVLFGCALIQVAPSSWLLLCSSTLALFLALAKRRGDLTRGVDAEHRPSLSGYNQAFLEHAMGITAGIALLSYALYSIEADVFRPGREFASLPFVAFGILDYLRLAHVEGRGDSPVDVVLHQPSILVCGLGWAIAVAWSLGILSPSELRSPAAHCAAFGLACSGGAGLGGYGRHSF